METKALLLQQESQGLRNSAALALTEAEEFSNRENSSIASARSLLEGMEQEFRQRCAAWEKAQVAREAACNEALLGKTGELEKALESLRIETERLEAARSALRAREVEIEEGASHWELEAGRAWTEARSAREETARVLEKASGIETGMARALENAGRADSLAKEREEGLIREMSSLREALETEEFKLGAAKSEWSLREAQLLSQLATAARSIEEESSHSKRAREEVVGLHSALQQANSQAHALSEKLHLAASELGQQAALLGSERLAVARLEEDLARERGGRLEAEEGRSRAEAKLESVIQGEIHGVEKTKAEADMLRVELCEARELIKILTIQLETMGSLGNGGSSYPFYSNPKGAPGYSGGRRGSVSKESSSDLGTSSGSYEEKNGAPSKFSSMNKNSSMGSSSPRSTSRRMVTESSSAAPAAPTVQQQQLLEASFHTAESFEDEEIVSETTTKPNSLLVKNAATARPDVNTPSILPRLPPPPPPPSNYSVNYFQRPPPQLSNAPHPSPLPPQQQQVTLLEADVTGCAERLTRLSSLIAEAASVAAQKYGGHSLDTRTHKRVKGRPVDEQNEEREKKLKSLQAGALALSEDLERLSHQLSSIRSRPISPYNSAAFHNLSPLWDSCKVWNERFNMCMALVSSLLTADLGLGHGKSTLQSTSSGSPLPGVASSSNAAGFSVIAGGQPPRKTGVNFFTPSIPPPLNRGPSPTPQGPPMLLHNNNSNSNSLSSDSLGSLHSNRHAPLPPMEDALNITELTTAAMAGGGARKTRQGIYSKPLSNANQVAGGVVSRDYGLLSSSYSPPSPIDMAASSLPH